MFGLLALPASSTEQLTIDARDAAPDDGRVLTRSSLALLLCVAGFGCGPDPEVACAALGDASCPAGQVNGEDTLYCPDYYEGSCSSEWDDYVECATKTPICWDAEAGTLEAFPCEEERYEHGHCLCEVESEHGWSPWCDLYGD